MALKREDIVSGRTEAFMKEAERQGLMTYTPPEQRQAWVDAMKPVWDKFAGDVGQDKIDAAQAINAGS